MAGLVPRVRGVSLAGAGTAVVATYGRQQAVQFDCGTLGADPLRFAALARHVFVSHGHLDHCAAAFLHARLRGMLNLTSTVLYVPAPALDAFTRAREAAEAMDDGELPLDIRAVQAGDVVRVSDSLSVAVHAASHRVPALSYVVQSRTRSLRPEIKALDAEAKRAYFTAQGRDKEAAFEWVTTTDFAYTGDTTGEGIAPPVLGARTLCVELTFLDNVTPDFAKDRGHIHIQDLASLASRGALAACERLVLMHFSARYSNRQIADGVKAHLPPALWSRVRMLWRPSHSFTILAGVACAALGVKTTESDLADLLWFVELATPKENHSAAKQTPHPVMELREPLGLSQADALCVALQLWKRHEKDAVVFFGKLEDGQRVVVSTPPSEGTAAQLSVGALQVNYVFTGPDEGN